MILAGDIGGTKSLLGLFDGPRCTHERYFTNAEAQNFESILTEFLSDQDLAQIDRACLALAGPIADDGQTGQLTNLPWFIDVNSLKKHFGLTKVRLVNDFAAAAQGAVTAPPQHIVTLQPGDPLVTAPRLVVGAGTGLGMALVLPDGNRWQILPGEGGHVAFAPANANQAALWQFLHQIHGRVTWERVVSGNGLTSIHEFVCGDALTPAFISSEALANPTSAFGRSLALFLSCYGAFAGDMALLSLARGGVYLAGGIAAKILPALRQGPFLEAFNAKAEHADIVGRMPVHVTTDPALGLKGAAAIAATDC